MIILTRQGGIWKDTEPRVKDGGVWKEAVEGYVKDAGVWKLGFSTDLRDLAWTQGTALGTNAWIVLAMSGDGTKVVTAVNELLYLYTNSGPSWAYQSTYENPIMASVTAAALSSDGTRMFICTDSQLGFVTTNGGAGWTQSEQPVSSIDFLGMSSDGLKLVASSRFSDYLSTSSDGGLTWTKHTALGEKKWTSTAISDDGTKIAACIEGTSVYTSSDSGATWVERVVPVPGLDKFSALVMSRDGMKIAVTGPKTDPFANYASIYTSADSGVTWAERNISPVTGIGQAISLAMSSNGKRIAAAYKGGYIYTSSDGGVSWAEETVLGAKAWSAIAFSSYGEKLVGVDSAPGYIYTGI